MDRFAPFESAPWLAVGVSGGADSLCLIHFADSWARSRGGRAVALVVDHRLRPESAAEAATVAGWMAQAGIECRVLRFGESFDMGMGGNLEDRAREGRYALLETWCRQAGVLHLLLAHHRDDQVETVLQRLARGSGAHGLAAMAPERTLRHLRVLRPLLDVPRSALAATLRGRGLAWIEDPSNRDPRFERSRLRRALAAIAADEALLAARIAHTAGAMRRTRRLLDATIDRLLARAVTVSPLGYAVVDRQGLAGADRDLAARALGLVAAAVGGLAHPPRRESMLHWLEIIAGTDGGATLGGVQLAPWRGQWLVHREPAAVAQAITLAPGETARWDDRFECALSADALSAVEVAAFGRSAPSEAHPLAEAAAVPRPAQSTLPAARFLDARSGTPHLSAGRKGRSAVYLALSVTFSPRRPLTDPDSPGGRYPTPPVGNPPGRASGGKEGQ